jgi:aldehyde dehydrogenase (NAD+)
MSKFDLYKRLCQLGIKDTSNLSKLYEWTTLRHSATPVPRSAEYSAGKGISVFSPIDGEFLTQIEPEDRTVNEHVELAQKAFEEWRVVPAPRRGELVRLYGGELRENKTALAHLIVIETGKTLQESLGEVQEMIDICDFAVGLSRQLYGLTIKSERTNHRMMETWHPLGPIAVISAFNFPMAVWAWNFALAIVCGNSVIWKPSEKTPLTAIACHHLFQRVANARGTSPLWKDLSQLVLGGRGAGDALIRDERVRLVSATGSTQMGKQVGPVVQERFGRSLLELGGNNAMIVTPSADFDQAVKSAVFGAVGTSGQRCTTLRRLFVHESYGNRFKNALKKAYEQLGPYIGNPLDPNTLVGPLIDRVSYKRMWDAMEQAKYAGGKILVGGSLMHEKAYPNGTYVYPGIVQMPKQASIVKKETFAPLLYLMTYDNLENAIKMQNDVKQGLSSSIFTTDMREAELFLSAAGSDCGIANVNIGTSGAEIGGAFGGEKETGGGRESGSDSWKAYMRRQTATINYSRDDAELAQGVKFNLEAEDETS